MYISDFLLPSSVWSPAVSTSISISTVFLSVSTILSVYGSSSPLLLRHSPLLLHHIDCWHGCGAATPRVSPPRRHRRHPIATTRLARLLLEPCTSPSLWFGSAFGATSPTPAPPATLRPRLPRRTQAPARDPGGAPNGLGLLHRGAVVDCSRSTLLPRLQLPQLLPYLRCLTKVLQGKNNLAFYDDLASHIPYAQGWSYKLRFRIFSCEMCQLGD